MGLKGSELKDRTEKIKREIEKLFDKQSLYPKMIWTSLQNKK